MSEAKQRYSKQRETIYNVLINDQSHPSVDAIYMKVRQIIPDISLGTVYRNLNLLADQGKIARLNFDDGVVHFDGLMKPHYHLVCQECGSVEDVFVDEETMNEFIQRIQKDNISQISKVDILFHGTCGQCLKKKS